MTSTQDYKNEEIKTEGENTVFSPSVYDLESKNIDIETLWKKIYSSLEMILSSEFSNQYKRVPNLHRDRISFACVYCGDSSKDPRKKRGNIFQETMQYHCFNGDCKAHMSLHKFFESKRILSNFTLEEQIYMREAAKNKSFNLKAIKAAMGLESLFSDDVINLGIEREYLMQKLKLQEIKGSRIERYLRDRFQTAFHKFGWDPQRGLLYIFNLTTDLTRVIGLQIKTFGKRNPYLTWKASMIHQQLGIYREENQKDLDKLDFLSNIFGIFQADLNKTLTIFEGPLDSFLFPNAVAVCSAKNSIPFEIEGSRYFYDNDATGREWAIKRITDGNSVFLWRKYLEENELSHLTSKIKDLNDLIIFIKRSKKPCKRFIDYFSENQYDMVWI